MTVPQQQQNEYQLSSLISLGTAVHHLRLLKL